MDKALKQRLVGASVLIALAVVVLPMLLGGGPESPQESRPIELPPKPRELSFETRRFPIGDQDPERPSVLPPPPENLRELPAVSAPDGVSGDERRASPPPGAGDAAAGESEGSPGAGMPAAESVAEQGPTVEPARSPDPSPDPSSVRGSPPAAPADARYLVQVASFSSVANARRLAARLTAEGMPLREDTVDSAAGTLHRVRVGPFAEQAEAERVIRRLESTMPDLRPRVLDLRPDEQSPVTTPSDPLVRWVVQVGSFGEQDNAEQLVFRLRDSGYAASSRAVSSNGAVSHKVRVGPLLEREEAVRLAGELRSELGLEGLVMSAD